MTLTVGEAAITALGAATPVGANVAVTLASIRAGIVRFAEHPWLLANDEPIVAARFAPLDDKAPFASRLSAMLSLAVSEALLTLPEPGALLAALPRDQSQLLAPHLRGLAPTRVLQPVEGEHSAGARALQTALGVLKAQPKSSLMVACADSWLERAGISFLRQQERLKTPDNSYGLIPGEAAVAIGLMTPTQARAERRNALATIVAVSVEKDPPLAEDEVPTGRGLTTAIEKVLGSLPKEAKIERWHCDMTGERWRGNDVCFTVARLARRFKRIESYDTHTASVGDVGAASAFLGTACLTSRLEHGYGLVVACDPGVHTAILIRK